MLIKSYYSFINTEWNYNLMGYPVPPPPTTPQARLPTTKSGVWHYISKVVPGVCPKPLRGNYCVPSFPLVCVIDLQQSLMTTIWGRFE